MSPTSYQAAPPRVRVLSLSTIRAMKLEQHTRFPSLKQKGVTLTLARFAHQLS
ncbi:Uncharacterised protein [Vibrio cholerae]|nr:Uncharacterised protein [Vibrio cholerae]